MRPPSVHLKLTIGLSAVLLLGLAGPPVWSQTEVRVETVNETIEKTAFAEIESIDPIATAKLSLVDREIPLMDVLEIRYPEMRATPVRLKLTLTDGSHLTGRLAESSSDEAIQFQTTLSDQVFSIPLESLRSLTNLEVKPASSQEKPAETDRVVTTRGATLEGVLLEVGLVEIRFQDKKLGELNFPWEQISRLEVAELEKAKPLPEGSLAILVEGQSGSRIKLALKKLSADKLVGSHPVLGSFTWSVRRLRTIQFLFGRVSYLSDRDPVEVEEKCPYIDPELFQQFFRWQRDRSVDHRGTPLQIGDRTYRKGLGVHSNSRLVFDLQPQDRLFQAWIGIDTTGRPSNNRPDFGSVVFKVVVDGEKKFDSGDMNWQKPARRIEIPVKGASRLELIVEEGQGAHILDRANWADARLIRDNA